MKPLSVAMAGLATVLLCARAAPAQDGNWPVRPLTFIATEVAGSATDIQARIVAGGMAPVLGQPIAIENVFGDAGIEKAIAAAPDGYTLVYGGTSTLALLPNVKKVSYDPLHDLTPVGRFVVSPALLAVNPALPANSVPELVALMKAAPGTLRMATAGAGTTGHLAGEMFIAITGVRPVVVHYPGGGPAIEAVVGNDAQWTMAPIAGRLPRVRSGALRALAAGSLARIAALPDVPTIAEQDYPGFDATGWAGIYVPNGTPQAVVDRLNAAIVTAVASPAVKAAFAAQGVEGASSTPAEAAKLLAEDHARIGDIARRIGMRAE